MLRRQVVRVLFAVREFLLFRSSRWDFMRILIR